MFCPQTARLFSEPSLDRTFICSMALAETLVFILMAKEWWMLAIFAHLITGGK